MEKHDVHSLAQVETVRARALHAGVEVGSPGTELEFAL